MRIYNSLTRQVEDFRPRSDGTVNVYCCGNTVYDDCHIGHAFSAVTFDVIVRYLRDQYGPERVRYVVNFTDIDDKILRAAEKRGEPWQEITEHYIGRYHQDMALLNVAPADEYPRATQSIASMIRMIQKLEEKGVAYVVEGDGVYFHVPAFEGYGKLTGRKLEDAHGDGRVERDERFKHHADFCVWKFWDSPDAWDSPWGRGRPGWHIECSAMAQESLGLPIDIHGGGMDLKFPHHENEIAQAEAAEDGEFSRVWMHHGLIERSGKKMGKSEGNMLPVGPAVETYGAGGLRHYFLGHLYRHPLKYDEKLIEDGAKAYARIVEARDRVREIAARLNSPVGMNAQVREIQNDIHSAKDKFSAGMDEDFNTAQALAAIHELVKSINKACGWVGEQLPSPEVQAAIKAAGGVLDWMARVLGFMDADGNYLAIPVVKSTADEVAQLVELLLELRSEARDRKDFDTADKIRGALTDLDIEVMDKGTASTWRRK